MSSKRNHKQGVRKDIRKEILSFCEKTIDKIKKECDLTEYTVHIFFHREDHYVSDSQKIMAEIEVDNNYMSARIHLSPTFVKHYKDKDFDYLTQVLCHEICHIRVAPLADLGTERWASKEHIRSEVERLTEHFGQVVYKLISNENRRKPN